MRRGPSAATNQPPALEPVAVGTEPLPDLIFDPRPSSPAACLDFATRLTDAELAERGRSTEAFDATLDQKVAVMVVRHWGGRLRLTGARLEFAAELRSVLAVHLPAAPPRVGCQRSPTPTV